MKTTRTDIDKLLREAVAAGANCVDRESFLAKINEQFSSADENADRDFRIYSIEELRNLKPGTILEHSIYGICRFEIYDGELVGFFDGPSPILTYAILSLGERPPWNKPMRSVVGE